MTEIDDDELEDDVVPALFDDPVENDINKCRNSVPDSGDAAIQASLTADEREYVLDETGERKISAMCELWVVDTLGSGHFALQAEATGLLRWQANVPPF